MHFGKDLTCRTGCKPDPYFTLNCGAAPYNISVKMSPSISDRRQTSNTSLGKQHDVNFAVALLAKLAQGSRASKEVCHLDILSTVKQSHEVVY